MPPHDPLDDFSQLPTADGAKGHAARGNAGQSPVRRPQTRIGPRAAVPEAPPPDEPPQAPAEAADPFHEEGDDHASDWVELIRDIPPKFDESLLEDEAEPEPFEEDAHPQPEAEPEPPPPPAPRRTVVGRRAPVSELNEPAPAEPAPKTEKPAAPPDKPLTRAQKKAAALEAKSQQAITESLDEPAAGPTPSSPPVLDSSASSKPDEDASKSPTDSPAEPSAPLPPGAWRQRWDKWGGKALSVSLLIHVLLLVGGATFVVTQVMEPQVDFLPGGGTRQGAEASAALEHQIQQKKRPLLKKTMPVRKIAVAGSISDVVLPDEVPDLLELPQSKDLLSNSKLTAGMGLGGAGGGFGKSMGLGSRGGMVFQPFSMFGMEIKAKRLAVVLDVSISMVPHLPRVIEELDKVAKGSVVVLYYGCGIEPPPPQGLDGDDVFSTSGVEFEKFWRRGGATLGETRKFRIDPKKSIENEAIFRILAKRPQTYFIHTLGLGYAWVALLSDQVRSADGLYWFSDFQDHVDFQQVKVVLENLQRRKQRLYMHAYTRGNSYDLVKTQLVEPTHGDVKLEEE